ncbi:MAG: ATP-binding protein [Acidobacteriaceae bacterium]
MVQRHYWIDLIEQAWQKRSIVWLAGVRRVGKTYLCRSLPKTEYFDCELPRIRRMMQDPEGFLDDLRDERIVLDEIHRLDNPSELLKIAADHYPDTRIIATGSSTLSASIKFKDTLAGRKRDLWLTPMCLRDLTDAKHTNLRRRLLRGGLPPFFLAEEMEERDFQEWMDAYWAKDIQELFRLERRDSFQKFTELILTQSGGIFEANKFAGPCEVSRPTIANYLRTLEATFVAHVIRPFSSRRPTEIVSAPKVYGFDTGFVCYCRGWQELRKEDLGILWEHFVLNEIMARLQTREIGYWRDKRGHEIDFVLAGRRKNPLAIECKWSADKFDPVNLEAFRRQHPAGDNVVLAEDVKQPFSRNYGTLKVRFEGLGPFIDGLVQ